MNRVLLLTSVILSSSALNLLAQDEKSEPPTANKSQAVRIKPIAAHDAVNTDSLQSVEFGNVKRMHKFGGIYLSGQPQADDFRKMQKSGIKTVINLRFADELDWDEEKVVNELGLGYHSIPFSAPETLTDEIFSHVRALLNIKGNHPILLHCSSSNRVGAVWLAHRVLDDGITVEEAEAEARTVGLKLAAYAAIAKGYVRREAERRSAIAEV